jgi:hypothetical protein
LRQREKRFRFYGEDKRLGQRQGSGCYFAIRRGIGLLFENKKIKLYFNEVNTIKKSKNLVLYLGLKENKHKRVVKMNAGC